MELTQEDQLVAEIERADEYTENAHRALASIDRVLQAQPPPAGTGDACTEPGVPPRAAAPGSKVKLPKISLPHF